MWQDWVVMMVVVVAVGVLLRMLVRALRGGCGGCGGCRRAKVLKGQRRELVSLRVVRGWKGVGEGTARVFDPRRNGWRSL
jgi:hypothetical protein